MHAVLLCRFDYCSHISIGCNCSPCHTDVDLSGKKCMRNIFHDLNLVGSEFVNLLSKLEIFSREHIWPNFAKKSDTVYKAVQTKQ